MAKILVTGGSGLVGKSVSKFLSKAGHEIVHLGRGGNKVPGVVSFRWSYKDNYIDPFAFEGVEYVVHLAGANVAGARWTDAYKKEIYDSRVLTTRLLFETIQQHKFPVKKVIAAAANGIYPDSAELMTEESPTGDSFLATVCSDWEKEIQKFSFINIPQTILRIGIVFSEFGGFIKEVSTPINWGVGAALGNGKQIISWIHIDDLCGVIQHAIDNDNVAGIYNCASPHPASNKTITKAMAKIMSRPLILPNAPAFMLKLLFGEFSYELLVNHNTSPQKLVNAGYQFKYPELEPALTDVLEKIK